jgi:hypothetical protein
MKIKTDLRAGNIVVDAANQADLLVDNSRKYADTAVTSVSSFAKTTTDRAARLWKCLSGA